MSAYKLAVAAIKSGRKTKEKLIEMIDVFLAGDRITTEEYTELLEMINELYN